MTDIVSKTEHDRLQAEVATYSRAATYWWRHYCEAVGREPSTTVPADAEFVAALNLLERKAAAFDYIEQNHTSSGGMDMSGLQTIVLGRVVGIGRTLLEAVEARLAKADDAWQKFKAAGKVSQ